MKIKIFILKGEKKMVTYPYSYYYNYSGIAGAVIAILVAIILGVVLYFTFLNKKNEGKYTGTPGKIYNFLNFNKFYAEDILKLLYIISAAVLTVASIIFMFLGTKTFVASLLLLVLGNVSLRVGYELVMMFIILCRKTVSVDRRLEKIEKFYGDDFDQGESTEEFCAEDSCPESGCGADPQSCESDPCCGCTAEDCRPGEDNEPTEEGDINASQR